VTSFEQVALGGALAILGGILAVTYQYLLTPRTVARTLRVEGSVRAAEDLLDLLEEARRLMPREPDEIPQEEVYRLCHRIQRKALLLSDAVARDTMNAVSDILWHSEYGFFAPQYSPLTAAWLCANEGREVLGALLRREPVTEVPKSLARLAQTVRDAYG
jgi:hypothetical protein